MASDGNERHGVDCGLNRFERLRYERGLTQQEVADGAGISRGTVMRLEQLRNAKPTAHVANALARFYGLTVSELLSDAPVDDEPRRAA